MSRCTPDCMKHGMVVSSRHIVRVHKARPTSEAPKPRGHCWLGLGVAGMDWKGPAARSTNAEARAVCRRGGIRMVSDARHVRRSCDLSSLTSSAAHSRASGIFPASLKARAFASAWFSADRSVAESLPGRVPLAVPAAADVLRIATNPTVRGFSGRQISNVNASIATSICDLQFAVALRLDARADRSRTRGTGK